MDNRSNFDKTFKMHDIAAKHLHVTEESCNECDKNDATESDTEIFQLKKKHMYYQNYRSFCLFV